MYLEVALLLLIAPAVTSWDPTARATEWCEKNCVEVQRVTTIEDRSDIYHQYEELKNNCTYAYNNKDRDDVEYCEKGECFVVSMKGTADGFGDDGVEVQMTGCGLVTGDLRKDCDRIEKAIIEEESDSEPGTKLVPGFVRTECQSDYLYYDWYN